MRFNVANFLGLSWAFLLLSPALSAQDDLLKVYFTSPQLGSNLSITCYLPDTSQKQPLADICWALVDSLNDTFSDYLDYSEVAMLRHAESNVPIHISRPLYDLIGKSMELSHLTQGDFDITIGSLTRMWREHLSESRIPSKGVVRRARKKVDYRAMSLIDSLQAVKLEKSGISLDFGGIAKGYIGDCLADLLRRHDVYSFLIDMGGDLVAGAPPPGRSHWEIKIPWLGSVIQIKQAAVATSGPDYQFFIHNGKKYTHIIDPGTGWGVSHPFSTTIVATSGWLADGLASAAAISRPDSSLALMNDLPGVEYIFGRKDQLFRSTRFEELIAIISRKK